MELARHGLLLHGSGRFFLSFLVDGHVLVLGVLQNQVQRLALEDFGGQGIEQIFLFKSGTNAARRLLVLDGNSVDLVVEIVVVDVQFLLLGDFLHDKMLFQSQGGAA